MTGAGYLRALESAALTMGVQLIAAHVRDAAEIERAIAATGDPSKEGVFAMRIKAAKGYYIPPHTHPKPEINTVISGTVRLGMGETADQSKAQPLPAGSFFALAPGMAHYLFFDEDTVVQVNTAGPWGLSYVNPKDDPRQKSQ